MKPITINLSMDKKSVELLLRALTDRNIKLMELRRERLSNNLAPVRDSWLEWIQEELEQIENEKTGLEKARNILREIEKELAQ